MAWARRWSSSGGRWSSTCMVEPLKLEPGWTPSSPAAHPEGTVAHKFPGNRISSTFCILMGVARRVHQPFEHRARNIHDPGWLTRVVDILRAPTDPTDRR